jgi:apolipoprotein N-acyltransferase
MTYQQLAMSRMRAVEHDRAVVVAATSGESAIIAPDGAVIVRSALFTPAALVRQVPLSTSATLATRLGALPEWVLTALGLAAVAATLLRARAARATRAAGERDGRQG